MSSAWSMPLRALATQTAVITMIGIGLAAPAAAAPGDPGSGNGNDKGASAKAEVPEKKTTDKGSTKSSPTASNESETTKGPDHSKGNAGTSGDYDEPQELSNADRNEGGANGKCPEGPYCSTRDGSASQNGKGDGEAKGKPCAGCVGKADNKNPKGQYPNGSDRNAGYECDRNQGVGQGNPAHTGCKGDIPTTTESCPDGSAMPPSGDVKDCDKGVKTCPDGSPLPTSGDMKDCDTSTPPGGGGGVVPPGIGGVDTEVPPTVTPPTVAPPVVAGVETLVPPAGVELYRPPADVPQATPPAAQALPDAAVLPATGAASMTTLLSALAIALLTLGAGTLLYRRATHG